MKYISRALEKQLAQAARHFPAVVLTGPRRAGKTLPLRRLFPKASYFLLEDPDVVGRLRADPPDRSGGRHHRETVIAGTFSNGARDLSRSKVPSNMHPCQFATLPPTA
jgi:hypothetical protein